MKIPNLKRVKVSSEAGLAARLTALGEDEVSVMLVTFNSKVPDKHLSVRQVQEALGRFGWRAGPRFTLNATLIGHVIVRD